MTARTASARHAACRTVALAAFAVVLAACGGTDSTTTGDPSPPVAPRADGSDGQPVPSGPTDTAAPTDGGQGADLQSSPGSVAAAFYQAVGDSRFGDACALFAPATQARIAAIGRDCRTELADEYTDTDQAEIGTVAVDESLVEVEGDTAEVPGDALSSTDGDPGAPDFARVRTTLIDGLWWVVTG